MRPTARRYFPDTDALTPINNAASNPKLEANAPPQQFSRLELFPLETWQADLAVGLTGAFLCSKNETAIASVPGGEGASIVNISSDLSLVGPDQRLYVQYDLPAVR